MDYLHKLLRQAKQYLSLVIISNNLSLIAVWYICDKVLHLSTLMSLGIAVALAFVLGILLVLFLANYLMQPVVSLWQSILHLSPDSDVDQPANSESISFGKELVNNLMSHVYQFINVTEQLDTENKVKAKDLNNNFVAQNLPLPMFMLDDSETIKFANQAAAKYMGMNQADLVGKNIYMILDMSFPSEDTFDNWLRESKGSSATASKSWDRVKLDVRDNHPMHMFDLAAYYNRENSDHNQTMLLLFDHTKAYSQDDQAISFVALSVHELRAPLTLLRGYIEVFEDELAGQLTPELEGFMEKMHSQAEQLMAFVNNILNVARIDDDQLELKLAQEDWPKVLEQSIEALNIRAKVRGIKIECDIDEGLPKVAIDRLSVQEVINNLVDNAIKYSGESKLIKINAKLNNNTVETTVQDFGVGIPEAAMPNLFTKFYRDHHYRSQIGGTGLGLYLCKALVKANGGNLWVRSKEGQGSIFGFTLQPYNSLNLTSADKGEVVKSAHGWIKNHSLYRR
jgi:signal transduction histidine kinase